MPIAFYSCKPYEQPFLEVANGNARHQLRFLPESLTLETVSLAADCTAVCVFVNDAPTRLTLQALTDHGIWLVALRCTGYNQVDIPTARELGIRVRKTVRGSIVGTRLDLAESLSFAAEGRVKVHYHLEPLENINQILTDMKAGQIDGRVVLDLN